ncbi:MAG: hydrogenase maturation nickel metallochaperone HypA [Congregibacter sp.]
MHEMALCHGMLELIEEQSARDSFDSVKRVIVEIGALGHVDPHALRFAFDVVAAGTVAADAALEIQEIPGKGWCMDCSKEIAVAKRGDGCPHCGSYTLIMQQGDEMRLKELEVH